MLPLACAWTSVNQNWLVDNVACYFKRYQSILKSDVKPLNFQFYVYQMLAGDNMCFICLSVTLQHIFLIWSEILQSMDGSWPVNIDTIIFSYLFSCVWTTAIWSAVIEFGSEKQWLTVWHVQKFLWELPM